MKVIDLPSEPARQLGLAGTACRPPERRAPQVQNLAELRHLLRCHSSRLVVLVCGLSESCEQVRWAWGGWAGTCARRQRGCYSREA